MIVGGIMFKEHQDNTEKEMKAYIDSKTKTTSNQPPLYYQAGAAVYVDGHMPEKR
jgi:hypothetical protein